MRSTSEVGRHAAELAGMPAADLADLIQQLTDQMHTAAGELQFELAARLRDEVAELKKELRGMHEAGVAR
jgi:excinuclease ABC subunit B